MFFALAVGNSMAGMGIKHGCAVSIDRNADRWHGRVVLARMYGCQYTLKEYQPPYLVGHGYDRFEIEIQPEMNLEIIGVATSFITPLI